MNLLWLCNIAPGAVMTDITGNAGLGGLWMDHVLSDLRQQKDMKLRILCPALQPASGALDAGCSYSQFPWKQPHLPAPELEAVFAAELETFSPDVIHIWGTEYAHTLAMVNAAEKAGLLDHTVISIQGLCSFAARHYLEGIPRAVQNRFTFRDLIRQDSLRQQQEKFLVRGIREAAALEKARHVIGRTGWDAACTSQLNPELTYHFCNETLRHAFYSDTWSYDACRKHRIFASGSSYPVKGFHHLLEAFREVLRRYPDATLAVPGTDCFPRTLKERLRMSSYQKYLQELILRYGLKDSVEFVGSLTEEQMKANHLQANVFVLCSTIENSPNALGEAMLLGVPCVASHVGGVETLLGPGEGFLYQSTAPYILADKICQVFAMEEKAGQMGQAARAHALITHDPDKNLQDLLDIYSRISK